MKRQISTDRQPWIRAAIYSFMTLTVTVIVALLTLVVLGYQFNNKDGKLEQGALLQFESRPSGATVKLDGLRLGSLTNTKSTVEAGSHYVTYDLAGYRKWQKTIAVGAGQIGWLSYARLIPQTVTTETLRSYATLTGAVASPSQRYMLLHEAIDSPVFMLADMQSDTLRYANLTIPADVYTASADGKTQTFIVESWSKDENAALVRHTYDDGYKTEWILLNRDSPDRSININTAYGVTPRTVQFAGDGNKLLFVHTDDVVRRINLDEQTLSRPLATKVAAFSIYDEKTIVYTTTADDKGSRTVAYAATDIDSPVPLSTYPDDQQVLYAAMVNYYSKRYVAVVHGKTLNIAYGSLPTLREKGSMKSLTTQALPGETFELVASRNNRFFVTQQRNGFATYDIELKKFDKTNWVGVTPISDTEAAMMEFGSRSLKWLDDYMLWANYDGTLRFYEFDGANQQSIMPVVQDPGFDVLLSRNNKFVYAIAKTDDGYALHRARMTVR